MLSLRVKRMLSRGNAREGEKADLRRSKRCDDSVGDKSAPELILPRFARTLQTKPTRISTTSLNQGD